jgi:hypothetical protein
LLYFILSMAALDLMTEIDNSYNIECHTIPTPEKCSPIISRYSIKLLHINIRSMQRNFNNFLVIFTRLNISFDLVILSECWINDNSTIQQIEGYTSFSTQKYINKSGGVVAYVNNKWSSNVSEPDIADANCLMIEVPNVFTTLGFYRSPSFRNTDNFIFSLDKLLESVSPNTCLIMAGDINIDILEAASDEEHISNYLELLASHRLLPTINKPTHSKTCIDHIFIPSGYEAEAIVCSSDLTDHDLIMIGIKTERQKATVQKRSRLKVDYSGLYRDLEAVDWSPITQSHSVDDSVSSFSTIITEALSKNSQIIHISHSKFCIQPWMTPGLIRCSKQRDKLHLISRQYPSDETKKLIYSRYRNFFIKLLRNLKAEYEKSELTAHQKSPKKLWQTINKITHRNPTTSTAQALTKICNSERESLNVCNEYFSSVGQNLANTILAQENETQESLAAKVNVTPSTSKSIFMSPTDQHEILRLIQEIDPHVSPGLDNINNKILKAIGPAIAEPLAAIFNQSIESGIFPKAWKSAAVVPIHKGNAKNEPSNYRPISLLGSLSKLLERIVNKRLVTYLESNSLLTNRQFGFRKGISTENAVTLLTNSISTHLDEGRACVGVFLDLAKAFDTVSVPILLKKLESYGIRGITLKWLTSYLTDRLQCVKIGDHLSSMRSVSFGVPQGSILGPTLFLLYINDITFIPIQNAEVLCYADDTAIVFHGRSWNNVYDHVEHGIALVSRWLRQNLLTLNTTKTRFLCFHKTSASAPRVGRNLKVHSSICTETLAQNCSCDNMTRSSTVNYLGIIIDEKLSFKEHVTAVSGRVRKLMHTMKMLRESADHSTLKTVYLALGQSIINYCILAWGGAVTATLLKLERAQRAVLKVALRKPIRYPTNDLYRDAKVLSVRKLYLIRVATHVHKSVLNSPDYNNLLQNRIFRIPVTAVKTSFARRFAFFLYPRIYNRLVSLYKYHELSVIEAKNILSKHLMHLSYIEIEHFTRIPY